MKTTFSFLILCFSLHALATDHLMYIGAGGEDVTKNDTIFDDAILNMGKYIKKNPTIKVNIALNGGHSKTEEIIKNSFPNAESKTSFLQSDYQRLILSYKKKLENGEMTSGDQLMIYIDSHGSTKSPDINTHSISVSASEAKDLNTLSGSKTVSLDELGVLKNLAKKKGVRLAIIDTSCHSGNTQSLADDNTCVISSTGPNHYGYNVFSQNFALALNKGKNLEDVFLQVRQKDITPVFPMISTESGKEVSAFLYDKVTPFFYYTSNEYDKLTPYMDSHDNDLACMPGYNSLLEVIKQAEDLSQSSKKILLWNSQKQKINLNKMKSLMIKYQKSYLSIKAQMKELGKERLNRKEMLENDTHKSSYTWKELITTDFQNYIASNIEREKGETPQNIKLLRGLNDLYKEAIRRKAEILKANPDLITVEEREKKITASTGITWSTTASIAVEERKLYSALYRPSEKANPCRDFKLP